MRRLGLLVAAVAGAVGLAARGSTPTDVDLTLTLQVDPVAQTWQAFGQITGDTTQTSGLAGVQIYVTGTGGLQIGTGGVDTTNNDMPVGGTGSFPIGFYLFSSPGTFGAAIQAMQMTFRYNTNGVQNNVLTGVGLVGQTQFGVTWGQPVLLADGTYTGTSGSLVIFGQPKNTTFLPATLAIPGPGAYIQTFSPAAVNTQGVQIITTGMDTTDTINAAIADASSFGYPAVTRLLKSGPGTLILDGTNTYSGSTTVVAGTLELNSVGALPVGSAVVNNGTLVVNADTITGPLTGSGTTIVAPGVTLVTDFSQGSLVNNGTVFVDGVPTIGSTSGSGALLFASRAGDLLTITSPNTGAGSVTINSGTLVVANATGSATGSGSVTLNGGTLGGYGTIAGAVVAGSGPHIIYPSVTLPATRAGTLTVGGLVTSANTTLNVNLLTPGASHSASGSVNDMVNVAGNNGLTFNGGTVEFTNHSTGAGSLGYYRIMAYSGAIGGGGVASLTLPAVANKIAYTLDTARDPGFIDVHRGLLGDANDDGVVDSADFVALSNHFGATNAGWTGADFNNDGVVNFADFVILSNNFGATIGANEAAGAASGVPEPASLILLGAGLLSVCRRRRATRPRL